MKFLAAISATLLCTGAASQAAEPLLAPAIENPRFKQFETEVAAFASPAAADALDGPATLFVGSSSIRLWNVAASFPHRHAINHGFGGATTADVLHYYRQVVGNSAPSSIIVYVGENDIAEGVAPERVAANVLTLLAQLRRDHPKARIAWLSMKPTPLRWDLYPRMAAVNVEISARAKSDGQFDYVDVGSALIGAQGRPGEEYFAPDRLHMSPRGYALWSAIIDAYLAGEAPRERLTQLSQAAS